MATTDERGEQVETFQIVENDVSNYKRLENYIFKLISPNLKAFFAIWIICTLAFATLLATLILYIPWGALISGSVKCDGNCQIETKNRDFASGIRSKMDLEIDPCDDFYKFSCGNFKTEHLGYYSIKNHTDVTEQMYTFNANLLLTILETNDEVTGVSKKMKDFYISCLQNKTRTFRRQCFNLTIENFPDVLARLFTQNVLTDQKKEKVQQLYQEISSTFQAMVERWQWLGDGNKETVKDKLRNITLIIGSPPLILDISNEEEIYRELSISKNGTDFEDNCEQLRMFNITRVPLNANCQLNMTLLPSAFYDPSPNAVVVPSGLLQKPYFDVDYPDVIQYSRLGFMIAHEFAHALHVFMSEMVSADDEWDLFKAVECLLESKYSLPNSTTTLAGDKYKDEDFADILGLQSAFTTFMERNKEKHNPLAGLENFSLQKTFFISTAQTWCRAYSSEEAERKFFDTYDDFDKEHSPHEFRVLIKMGNNLEFSKAFNCSSGSKYNPEKKCVDNL